MSRWLDRTLGFVSQSSRQPDPGQQLHFPTPQGPLRVHPLICSEALLSGRVQDGLGLAGGDLLTNHTNDGWFERSPATDLHAAQIRLRAVEAGLPLLRATLTGKSGLFREDGSWDLWGEAHDRGGLRHPAALAPHHHAGPQPLDPAGTHGRPGVVPGRGLGRAGRRD